MSHAGARIASLDDLESVEGLDEADEQALRSTYPQHCSKADIDSIVKKFRKNSVKSEGLFLNGFLCKNYSMCFRKFNSEGCLGRDGYSRYIKNTFKRR